jgi:hypothetical protein
VRPAGPEHITALMVIVDGAIHATVSFHSSVFDQETIQAAVNSALNDPIALLAERVRD